MASFQVDPDQTQEEIWPPTPPDFSLGIDDMVENIINEADREWDSQVDDQTLLDALEVMEKAAADDTPGDDTIKTEPPAEPVTKRHAVLTEEQLTQLEMEKNEKNTVQVTLWAVKVLKGIHANK